MEWKSMYYFGCSLDIPLSTIQWNKGHTWIMVMMRPTLRTFWLLERNITIFTIDMYGQGILSSSTIINIGNKSNIKDLSTPEIHKLFWKRKVFGRKESYSKSDVNPYTLQTCRIYLPTITLSEDLENRWLGWSTSISKDWGHKGNKGPAKVYSRTWLTIHYLKSMKKNWHDTSYGMKVGACTNNFNLMVNYSELISVNLSFNKTLKQMSYFPSFLNLVTTIAANPHLN